MVKGDVPRVELKANRPAPRIVRLCIMAYDMRPEIKSKTLSKSLQFGLTMAIKRRFKIVVPQLQHISSKNALLIAIFKN